MTKQTTFMMLKPDAFHANLNDTIVSMLENAGLTIEQSRTMSVDIQIMKTLVDHYAAVIDKQDPSFNFPGKLFNSFYYHGPHTIMPMIISYEGSEDIIDYTRELIGATNPQDADKHTIRGALSDDNYEKAGQANRLVNNLIHAADSLASKEREVGLWSHYFEEE